MLYTNHFFRYILFELSQSLCMPPFLLIKQLLHLDQDKINLWILIINSTRNQLLLKTSKWKRFSGFAIHT